MSYLGGTKIGAVLNGGDHGKEVTTVVTKSAREPGKWQATRFDPADGPFGHTTYGSLDEAVEMERRWGATLERWMYVE